MKIALITIWHEKNFGAELQAYATIKALISLGHNVQMINFRLNDDLKLSLRSKIIRFLTSMTKETYDFNKFWKKYIPTTRRYKTLNDLKDNPPVADMYLVGSDQVWNPAITKDKAEVYFLNFGPQKVIRASYASSFGTNFWQGDDKLTSIAYKRLSEFKYLSCRETSGVKLLESQFSLNAKLVIDPTLLFESYDELTGPIVDNNTVVFYPLFPVPEIESLAKHLAKLTGKEFLNINNMSYLYHNFIWSRTTLSQWVTSIAEASLVITHSFHGLVFSLLYHRQFIIIQTQPERSARLTNLLTELDLMSRFFISVDDVLSSKIWEQAIDYTSIDKKLNKMRLDSWAFLKTFSK